MEIEAYALGPGEGREIDPGPFAMTVKGVRHESHERSYGRFPFERPNVRERPLSDAPGSAHVFDDLDEFVKAVAVMPGELDQLLRALDDETTFGCPGNRNATPASELE